MREAIRAYAETTADIIREALAGAEVRIIETSKINIGERTGLTIIEENVNCAPTYYIDEFFKAGKKPGETAHILLDMHKDAMGSIPPVCTKAIDLEFDNIKSKLAARLVSGDLNAGWLADKVSRHVGADLYLTAVIELDEEHFVTVSRQIAETFNYDEDEVIDTALRNDAEKHPAFLNTLMGMSQGFNTGIRPKNLLDEAIAPDEAYALTNTEAIFGAASLFHEGVLDKLTRSFGKFFILPSSIHELIIMPMSYSDFVEEMRATVAEANSTVVSPEDLLSNGVYLYDGRLERVA